MKNFLAPITSLCVASIISSGSAADNPEEFAPQPPVAARSPAEEAKTFQLPPGYHLELLLSEPQIKEPVGVVFDGDGKMFVTEMRTYMQEIDGKDEFAPVSCVSLHWSSKADGVYDKHTVFADKLVLPRMVLPLGPGQAVIGETNTNDLFLYTDTDGDGVSDKKEPWYVGGARGGNLEHQPSGLVWALDNAIYTTYNQSRLRWTPQGVRSEPTAANNGQWGLGQDNHGNLYFVNAGGERGPQSFQSPTVYGMFNPSGQFAPGFEEVWPAAGVADVQGGHGRHRPDGTLNHLTAAAGSDIYRGDALPKELSNNLFFGEPVGRLVRRAIVGKQEGLTVLSNPYQAQKSEFLRSTDLCFRPMNMATAPDGTLYIVDMYRGIIQEGNWVREGSYLRKVVQQYSLDKVAGHGRIWRLVHDTTKLGPQPHMNQETPAQLVAHLYHPNGWWRDTAQRLLILKQDKSVVPALTAMARTHTDYLARLHALWTLEGLNALTPALVREKLKDSHPQMRLAAIRVSESLCKGGELTLKPDVLAMAKDPDPEVLTQCFLTAKLLNWPGWKALTADAVKESLFAGVKTMGELTLDPNPANAPKNLSPQQKKVMAAGAETFNTLCASCHGPDGKGMPMAGAAPGAMLAPALAGSKTINGPAEGPLLVLLNGLTGDIDGKKYEGIMIPMADNSDQWISNVLSYVRNSFGNHEAFVDPSLVSALRLKAKSRTQPWTMTELRASLPKPLDTTGWKITASHNAATVGDAIDHRPDTRWTSGTDQVPGIWFCVELPKETAISSLQLDNSESPGDFPRGYLLELSTDGKTWTKPVPEANGSAPSTQIDFPSTRAKFVRITQTGQAPGRYWSIHELQIQ